MRLCGVLIASIMLSSITSVNSIDLYKMNLHKAISNNLKDAVEDKDDDEDGDNIVDEKMTMHTGFDDVLAYQKSIEGKSEPNKTSTKTINNNEKTNNNQNMEEKK